MDSDTVTAAWDVVPDPGWVLVAFLLSFRLAAVVLLTPVLSAFSVPVTARVLVLLGLAAALTLGMPSQVTEGALAQDAAGLVAACVTEAALGATLALGVLVAFAAISMAGRLVDVQTGFGIAQVFDPVSQQQVPVVTSAFDKLGVIVFFLANGHHALVRGVSASLERFPLGQPWPIEAAAPWVLQQVAALFVLGFALAAPVVLCLLVLEVFLGVVSRNLPQMNIFIVGAPLRIGTGLLALAVWAAGMGPALARVYESIYRTWDGIFAAAVVPRPGAR